MTVGYSELTFWPANDDAQHSYTLRVVDNEPVGEYRLEIGNDTTEAVFVMPVEVFYEMAKHLPDLENYPDPLPLAEEVD